MEETLKKLTLQSSTTLIILKASDSTKGLEIDVKGLGQRLSIQFNGTEVMSVAGDGSVVMTGTLAMANIPTSDPHVVGELFVDSLGVVRVSAG